MLKLIGAGFYGGCLYHVITTHVFMINKFEGVSMYPTINSTAAAYSNNYILVEMWTIKFKKFKKQDIVVLRKPDQPNVLICKRITRLQGEKTPPTSIAHTLSVIPRGHVWVEGDNPSMSDDSRHFGPVPIALIQSKVLFRVWPLSQFGWVT